jgi:ABC-type branched-subunit amino acid transport system substrate-binding protein
MSFKSRRASGTVAVLAAMAVLAAACGTASTTTTTTGKSTNTTPTASAPGITATEITLGSTQPLTGAAAPGYDEIAPASQAVFDWVNAHGGVYGRKIVDKYLDDAYTPSETVTKTQQLLSLPMFADFDPLGTPTQLQVQSLLNKDKVPQLFVASGCACWSLAAEPWTSGWQPNYVIEGKILGKYIATHYAGKKVAFIYQGDEFGQDGVLGLDEEIPAADVVAREPYSVALLASGLGDQVAAAQAAHAQVVVLFTIPAATALALLAAATLKYAPQWASSNVGADVTTLDGLISSFSKGAAGGSLLNGIISDDYLPSPADSTNPWIELFHQIYEKYDNTKANKFDGNTEYGMAVGITMVELLKAAGPNPTRASLLQTLNTDGHSLNTPGLVPLSYSATDHYGYQGTQIGQIENGKFTLFGPVYVATNHGPISSPAARVSTPPSFANPGF